MGSEQQRAGRVLERDLLLRQPASAIVTRHADQLGFTLPLQLPPNQHLAGLTLFGQQLCQIGKIGAAAAAGDAQIEILQPLQIVALRLGGRCHQQTGGFFCQLEGQRREALLKGAVLQGQQATATPLMGQLHIQAGMDPICRQVALTLEHGLMGNVGET